MRFAILFVFGGLALVGCSNQNAVRPSSIPGASSSAATASVSPDAGLGFNGTVSGFPTGTVFVSGGGTFDRDKGFVKSGGGFSCCRT